LNLHRHRETSWKQSATSASTATTTQAVTLTATVTGGTPTGTVTFLDGAIAIGTGTLDGAGSASLSHTFAMTGSRQLTARYEGDGTHVTSTSAIASLDVAQAVAAVYYIQPDQLNTPRTVTDTAGNLVWSWDNTEAFGNNMPNENPASQGQFTLNLRFPGQYYDSETGLAYNVNRSYDAAIGRYIESDPLGLAAGVNTFAYVGGNPLILSDQLGLFSISGSVGGESTPVKGVSGSYGGFITGGGDKGQFDAGVNMTSGTKTGFNGGLGIAVDFWKGGREVLDGRTVTKTVCFLVVCFSEHENLDGQFTGAGASIGPGLPGGFSESQDTTRSFTLRDLTDLINGWINRMRQAKEKTPEMKCEE